MYSFSILYIFARFNLMANKILQNQEEKASEIETQCLLGEHFHNPLENLNQFTHSCSMQLRLTHLYKEIET